jgi:putative membrane protein
VADAPAPTADAARRRTHPATPLVHVVQGLPGVVFAAIILPGNFATGWAGRVVGTVALVLVFGGVLGAFRTAEWWATTFWFDDDGDLRVDSGVLQRNQRRLQLSRLQTVEVVQPWMARLVSMGGVRVEAAGAGESRVVLTYLPVVEAQAFRDEVIARAAGVLAPDRSPAGAGSPAPEGSLDGSAPAHGAARPAAPVAPERVLAAVPNGDLMLSLLLRSSTLALVVASMLILTVTYLVEGSAALGLTLITGGVPLLSVANEFLRFGGFTVADSPDGLRIRSGLLSTASGTVPPGRVQAIGFEEPWLWRRFGWVRVRLNVAGAPASSEHPTGTVLLPVAPWAVALDVVAHVLPGVDVRAVPLESAPRHSRWRAPIEAPMLAVGADERVLVARRGRVVRKLAVVPHARTQSVRVTQGPWERALGLASLHVDSTPGPVDVTAPHLDAVRCRELAEAQADRARAARADDAPQRWMQARRSGGT